jgi:hypothetical protein
MKEVTSYDVTELDSQERQTVNGGIDNDGSGVQWALGYSFGWCQYKVEVAIDYYRYNFP